jgi:hypothetical protein
MVITHTIICSTCSTKHLLKVTLGYEKNQYHSFPCTSCEEEIKFGIEGLPYEGEYKYIKNCEYQEFGYAEAIQVLLHPDLAVGHTIVEAGDVTTAIHLNVQEMHRMLTQQVSGEVIEHRIKYQNPGSEKLRFYLKIWSLLRNDKIDIARSYATNNASDVDVEILEDESQYIEGFLNHFMGEFGLSVYSSLKSEWNKTIKNDSLVNFHNDQNVDEYSIFEEFFEHFSEFSQVFLYTNRGIKVDKDRKSSSSDFNKTKKYYSSAYETLAKKLYIPAGINNLLERGNAHTFQRLSTLSAYMNTGNGDKLRCLANNHELAEVGECYDNHLRNASFHNHMNFNPKKSKITYKKNSGQGCSISYQEYLIACVKITEALAAYTLFGIEALK